MVLIDLLQKITTPIICKSGRSTSGTATGFFFGFNDKLFLITNRHVFVDEKRGFFPDSISIRLNKVGQDLTQSEEITYRLYNAENATDPKWIQLADDIDLVALEVEKRMDCVWAALTSDNIANPDDLHLGLGEQVLVIGYPMGFYDTVHNLPIVRSACVASTYGLPFQKKQFFLIDSVLHPGTSGSPVITVPKTIHSNPDGALVIGGKPIFHFLGVNSGSFGDLQLNSIWYGKLLIELLSRPVVTTQPAISTVSAIAQPHPEAQV